MRLPDLSRAYREGHGIVIKKSWLFVLPLVVGLMWIGAAPTQAAGENWIVKSVDSVGCGSNDWGMTTVFSGVDGAEYVAHTVVQAGGLVYMNEDASFSPVDGADESWNLYTSSTYGPTTGDFPIPAGQQMKVTFTLERPKGTVLSSWTLVAASCDSNVLRYNNATSLDTDGDFVTVPTDKCPSLAAAQGNGCPVRDRTLTLRARYGPKRVVGRLYAPGYPSLYAGRVVKIWKKRPGPDQLVRTRTTNNLGKFRARLPKGRYYATASPLVVPSAGQTASDVSPTRRLR